MFQTLGWLSENGRVGMEVRDPTKAFGCLEVHESRWSTITRVDETVGAIWFKNCRHILKGDSRKIEIKEDNLGDTKMNLITASIARSN